MNSYIFLFCWWKKEISGIDILKKYYINEKNLLFINGDKDRLKDLYKNVTRFITPSLQEGFGATLIKVMWSGCSIALSNVEVFKVVAGIGLNYFDTNDITDIKDKLESLLFYDYKFKEAISYSLIRAKNFS